MSANDFLDSLSRHHRARHDKYYFSRIAPRDLKWLYTCNHQGDPFEECTTSIYFADENEMTLIMWNEGQALANIKLKVTVPSDNDKSYVTEVTVTDLLGKNEHTEITQNSTELRNLLFHQGFKIKTNILPGM